MKENRMETYKSGIDLSKGLKIHNQIMNQADLKKCQTNQFERFSYQIRVETQLNGNHTSFYGLRNDGVTLKIENNQIFNLSRNGSIHIDLPVGTQYSITQIPKGNYNLEVESISGTTDHTVQVVNFKNTFKECKFGGFMIENSLVNEHGSDLSLSQKKLKFQIEIRFSDGRDHLCRINNGDSFMYQNTSVMELKHGDIVDFYKLEEGLHYRVIKHEPLFLNIINDVSEISGVITQNCHQNLFMVSVEFSNLDEGVGSLLVTNDIFVKGNSESNIDGPYYFSLHFSEAIAPQYQINGGSWLQHDGHSDLSIRNKERILFNDIPTGVSFTASVHDVDGYIGQIESVRGVIAKNRIVVANFYMIER